MTNTPPDTPPDVSSVSVQTEDFDAGREIARLEASVAGQAGAVCSFLGLVRGAAGDDGMTLEHYPGMTYRELCRLVDEAKRRWPLDGVRVIHRHGRLRVGEQIVLVLTASAHREAAFEACAFLMDWLKTKAPFWKQEHTAAGTHWVEAKESDTTATERWQT